MNIWDLITYKEYPSEEYKVMTDDGYIITINRIPFATQNQRNPVAKPAVFLQHGLLGDASNWVANLPNNSLALMLADAGYDVWMRNSGGNHEFWVFSFDEMAKFDLPAAINFIVKKTGQEKLYYIDYSQGTTVTLIAFSTVPELAQKIKLFFALAHATAIKYARSPATKLLYLPEKLLWVCGILASGLLGKREFLPQTECLRRLIVPLCSHRAFARLCRSVFFSVGGYNGNNIDMKTLDACLKLILLYWTFIPALLYVFQATPPLYNVEQMVVPTADAAILLSEIKRLLHHKMIPEWTRLDFIWGLDAPSCVYN
uniref:Partial AB-hydrolase lipase domain-containing protein n=1 Tax=Pavo cristatus TaxID=9049 RepID=A0A8C9LFJ7_PAVCR